MNKFIFIGNLDGRLWLLFPLAEICLHLHVIFLGFIFPVLRAEPRN